MKRFLYYLIILYAFLFTGTCFLMLSEKMHFLEHLKVSLGFAMWGFLFGIPYNFFSVVVVVFAYCFNEIKKYESLISFLIAYVVGLLFIIIYAFTSSTTRDTPERDITFWNSLSFSNDSIDDPFKLFLIGTFVFVLLMIPIHTYFRKKYKFLNKAR